MVCKVKLYSILRLQTGTGPEGVDIDLAPATALVDVIDQLALSPEAVSMILVNGDLERDHTREIADQDVIQLFPRLPSGG